MVARESVEAVLGTGPAVHAGRRRRHRTRRRHGQFRDVRLTGMCAGCPSAHMTLHVGVETALREEIPEFETLRLV